MGDFAIKIHWMALDRFGDLCAACGADSDTVTVVIHRVNCEHCKRTKAWPQPGEGQEKTR